MSMSRVPAALVLCLAAAALPGRADEVLVDGIAAQVGGEVVLISEVMQTVGPREAQARAAGLDEIEIAKMRADALEQLIEWRLIERVVEQAELYATDEEIDEAIGSIASENNLTMDQVKQSVVAGGLSWDEYRDEIKREIERRKVVNAMVATRVRVDDADVEALYRETFSEQPDGGTTFHLRQILVARTPPAEDGTPPEPEMVCAAAAAALARIEAGEAFENVAAEVSGVEPRRGGDIGWLHEDQIASWMSDVLATLQDGQVSGVIELPFGCSLLKLVERRAFEPMTLEQATPMLQQRVFERTLNEELTAWMEKLRESTYIQRHGYFAEAAQLGSQSPYAEKPDEEGEEEEDVPLIFP